RSLPGIRPEDRRAGRGGGPWGRPMGDGDRADQQREDEPDEPNHRTPPHANQESDGHQRPKQERNQPHNVYPTRPGLAIFMTFGRNDSCVSRNKKSIRDDGPNRKEPVRDGSSLFRVGTAPGFEGGFADPSWAKRSRTPSLWRP